MNPLVIFRFAALIILAGIIFFFASKGIVEKNQKNGRPVPQDGSSLSSAWKNGVEKIQMPETATSHSAALAISKLEGHFSPSNEKELIEQLVLKGYIGLFSYELNADGRAVIMAMHGQQAIQPIVTINVDKNGDATSRE